MKYRSVNTIARPHDPAVSAASDDGYWIYKLSLVYVAQGNKQTLKDLFLQTFSKVRRIKRIQEIFQIHTDKYWSYTTYIIMLIVDEDITKDKTNYFSGMMTVFMFKLPLQGNLCYLYRVNIIEVSCCYSALHEN